MSEHKILVPFDFSPCSKQALETALRIAKKIGSRIHLIHVLEGNAKDDSERRALEQLQGEVLPSDELQTEFQRTVLYGNVPNEIVQYAAQNAIDMIVIGTRGRSGVLRFAMGSVAQSVLKKAPCPVVIVNHESVQRDANGKENITDPADTAYLQMKPSDSAALDLVSRAVGLRATDIHVDPADDDQYQVRLRIDGKVRSYCMLDPRIAEHLMNQCMTIAQMDLADPFRPREGRMLLPDNMKSIEVRITTAPVAGGTAMAMRLFSKENVFLPLENLGFSANSLSIVQQMLDGRAGLILVTGPTGSGKTTSVYSMLETFGREKQNIVSIEDPVEFSVPFVRQMSVDDKHDITMTSGLRTLLRMDPDILFVGEIRDEEAAAIATRAAGSGAFVFSSLHARDVAGTITMLREFNIPPRNIASALAGIINQRLVRRLCVQCRKPIMVDEKRAKAFQEYGVPVPDQIYEPAGCDACRGSGFYGRSGIFEVIACSGPILDAIATGASESELRHTMRTQGFVSLGADALSKVADGTTNIEEALSMCWL
ncbi:MAG: ATPase, T2SS/T4P/T4SS family [Pirellula sp.]